MNTKNKKAKIDENILASIREYYSELGLSEKELNSIFNSKENSPYDFTNISNIAEKILKYKDKKVMIFGDYDCDGITATSILCKTLERVGFNDVICKIPHRDKDGYGINEGAIKRIFESECSLVDKDGNTVIFKKGFKPDLIITVDNGVAVTQECLDYIKSNNVDLIITDHHEISESCVIDHDILLHPAESSFRDISGATVAYKLAQVLLDKSGIEYSKDGKDDFFNTLVELAGISLISDCMPMCSEKEHFENRAILKYALARSVKCPSEAISILEENNNCVGAAVDEKFYGFTVGPMINAPGRISDDTTELALRLFLVKNEVTRDQIYASIKQINDYRKRIVQNKYSKLKLDDIKNNCIIEVMPDVKPGIAGLIAGKLSETGNCPAFVLVPDPNDDTLLKGSARAPKGYDLFGTVDSKFKDLFYKFGGHSGAAGFSVKYDSLNKLKKTLKFEKPEALIEHITALEIDNYEWLDDSTLAKTVISMKPFGQELPAPMIYTTMTPYDVASTKTGHIMIKPTQNFEDSIYILYDTITPEEKVELKKCPELHFVGELNYTYQGKKQFSPISCVELDEMRGIKKEYKLIQIENKNDEILVSEINNPEL